MSRPIEDNLNFNLNQAENLVIETLSLDPPVMTEARIWYNSTQKVLKYWNGSKLVVLPLREAVSAGTVTAPIMTTNIDGSLTLSTTQYALFNNAAGVGFPDVYTINGQTLNPIDQTVSYVVADYNGGNPITKVITDVSLINETTVIPVYTVFRYGTRLHTITWDSLGSALANKIHQSLVKTERYRRESGLALSEYGTRNVSVSSGSIWIGAVNYQLPQVNSDVDNILFCYHSNGSWVTTTVHQYNNTQYDNGFNLVATSGNRYVVNFIYRGVETESELYMVLGSKDYTLSEAQGSQPPASLPTLITSHAVLIGRIIVAANGTTASQIDSAFAINFTGSTLTANASVQSIQFDTTPNLGTINTGLTYWDAVNSTLATVLDPVNGVVLQHGQEMHLYCWNSTGTTIPNGTAVYINGASGNKPTIAPAIATSFTTSRVIGVTTQAILNGTGGYVTLTGDVHDYDTSGFSNGAALYLSPTVAGALTTTPPADPYFSCLVGFALNSTNNGIILVAPKNPRAAGNPFSSPSDTLAPTQKAIATYAAPINSPTFTGVPAAPTATAGTNTTQIATTAFVTTAISNAAPNYATYNQTFYVGTTAIAVNRASAEQGLTGITSISGSTVSVDGATLTLGGTTASVVNLGTSTATQVVNIGTGSGVTTINLGGAGDTVNIAGTLTYINTTNLTVTDKMITLNKGGVAASGNFTGIEVEENSAITGYIRVDNGRASWAFVAPASTGSIWFTPSNTSGGISEIKSTATTTRTFTLPDKSGTLATTLDGVYSFNTRAGAVTLTSLDVTNALTYTPINKAGDSGIGALTGTSFNSITGLSASNPLMDGVASVGTATLVSREDHVHPSDTSKANVGQTFYLGTTQIAINRASATQALTGITSIDGSAATLTTPRTISTSGDVTGTATAFNGSANIAIPTVIADTVVNGKLLTGFALGTSQAQVSATNTILQAFSTVQVQLNGKNQLDTGLISGGTLSINSLDNTKFDIGLLTAYFSDHSTPTIPTGSFVTFGPTSAVTLTNLTSQNVTYVGINVSGTIIQQATPFTNAQRRTIVSIGVVVHSNRANINAINYIGATDLETTAQLHDFMSAVGPVNVDGNSYSVGPLLALNKTSGTLFKFGSNFQNSSIDPHVTTQVAVSGITFRYRLNSGTEYADTTSVDPNYYDLAGVKTAVPSGKFTVQRIYMFQSGLTRLQYGQKVYNSMAEAISNFENEPFIPEENINYNGILRGYVIVKQGTSDLTVTTNTIFIGVSKFGNSISGNGGGLTYDLITSALGFTPINKAGDSGIGNLSMGTLTATTGTFSDILYLSAPSGVHYLAIGNQDSGGTNNPSVISSVNGSIYLGNGTSWSGLGTVTNYASFSSSGCIFSSSISSTYASFTGYPAVDASIGYALDNGLMLRTKSGTNYNFSILNPGNTSYLLTCDLSNNWNFMGSQVSMGALSATTITKSGGTSTQFLKADGSVDSTSYESALGNPPVDGYVLSSTIAGVRSWIAAGGSVYVSDDTTTNATYYPLMATTAGGNTLKTSSTKLTFNPSTGVLSAVIGTFIVPTGVAQINLKAGTSNTWQLGANAGAGTSDDTFSIYSYTYGPTNGYAPIFKLDSAGNATFIGPLSSTSFNDGVTVSANARNRFHPLIAGTSALVAGWVAAAFGDTSADNIVIGQDSGRCLIGAHNGALNAWSSLNFQATYFYFRNTGGSVLAALDGSGNFSAVSKSFLINHPTKPNMKLKYACLEGPENGVYFRGRLTNKNTIELPEYWVKLVGADSLTVSLTPIGPNQSLYIESMSSNIIVVANENSAPIDCFFIVYGERVDIEKLVVEF